MYVTFLGDRTGTLPAGWINETILALPATPASMPPGRRQQAPG